jgi:prevent-host-death family protein
MTSIPLSDAKTRLSEVADEVHRTHQRVNVTRNGRDYVVIVAAEELESLEATIELLSDAAAQQRIARAEQDLASGQHTSLDEMARLMDERRRGGR